MTTGVLAGEFVAETTGGGLAGVAGTAIAGDEFVPETTRVEPASFRIWLAKPLISTNSVGNTWARTAAMKTAPDIENAVPAITSMVPKRNGMSAANDA